MVPSTRLVLSLAVAGMVLDSMAGMAQSESGLPPETLMQSTPLFAFQSQDNNRGAVVFIRSGSPQEHDPRVFVASRNGWRLIQLSDELHNTSWVFAGRAMKGTELLGDHPGKRRRAGSDAAVRLQHQRRPVLEAPQHSPEDLPPSRRGPVLDER